MKRGAFFDKIENNPKRLRRLEQEKKEKEFEKKRETILKWKKMVEDGLEFTDELYVGLGRVKVDFENAGFQLKIRHIGFQIDEYWASAPQFFQNCVTYLLENPNELYWETKLKTKKEREELVFFFETIGWKVELNEIMDDVSGNFAFWHASVTPQ